MIEVVEYPYIRVLDDVIFCVKSLIFCVHIVNKVREVVKYAHVRIMQIYNLETNR